MYGVLTLGAKLHDIKGVVLPVRFIVKVKIFVINDTVCRKLRCRLLSRSMVERLAHAGLYIRIVNLAVAAPAGLHTYIVYRCIVHIEPGRTFSTGGYLFLLGAVTVKRRQCQRHKCDAQ